MAPPEALVSRPIGYEEANPLTGSGLPQPHLLKTLPSDDGGHLLGLSICGSSDGRKLRDGLSMVRIQIGDELLSGLLLARIRMIVIG